MVQSWSQGFRDTALRVASEIMADGNVNMQDNTGNINPLLSGGAAPEGGAQSHNIRAG